MKASELSIGSVVQGPNGQQHTIVYFQPEMTWVLEQHSTHKLRIVSGKQIFYYWGFNPQGDFDSPELGRLERIGHYSDRKED